MTIFRLGASLSCKISLSLLSKEEDTPTTTTKKKHRLWRLRKKGKNTNLPKMVAHFFCVKKTSLSAALFGCFRRVRIIWCVNSRLFRLLFSLGSERHAKTRRRRQRRRRKRKTLRFVVVIPVAFFFSSHEKRRNFCCEISLRDEWVRRISHQSDRIETSARKYVYNKCETRT